MEIPTRPLNNEKYHCTFPIINRNGPNNPDTSHTNWQVTDEMKEDGFRVSVCLQRYFSDERSRAYVNVVRRLPVRWLRQRLRSLFGLQGSFCLCSRGHLLPPDEPLSLLQPDDPVEVIPMSDKTLEWDENGFMYNKKKTTYDIESSLPPKTFTELQAANLIQETDKDLLLRMKEKALAILDTCDGVTSIAELSTGPAISATEGSDKPRRTRRRVRRRKRRFSGDESSGGNIQEKYPTDSIKVDGESTLTDVLTTSTQSCTKLSAAKQKSPRVGVVTMETVESKNTTDRSTSAGPRPARLVRSLSPSYGQTPPLLT